MHRFSRLFPVMIALLVLSIPSLAITRLVNIAITARSGSADTQYVVVLCWIDQQYGLQSSFQYMDNKPGVFTGSNYKTSVIRDTAGKLVQIKINCLLNFRYLCLIQVYPNTVDTTGTIVPGHIYIQTKDTVIAGSTWVPFQMGTYSPYLTDSNSARNDVYVVNL